jgi:hypothetical protein
MSTSRFIVGVALGCGLMLTTATGARAAKCDPTGADAASIAAARAAIDQACDCEGARNHGQYVRCAAAVLKAEVGAGNLPKSCKGAVQRCAARSTCGKAGFVTCCRTNAKGKTSCSIKSSMARCTAPRGGSACVGNFSSCCEACDGDGCVPVEPTPTPEPTATPEPTPTAGSASRAFIAPSDSLF